MSTTSSTSNSSPATQDTVRFQEIVCSDQQSKIAVATLCNPKALNALTHNMLVLLNDQLEKWHDDDAVLCVILDGEGEKAFCAGGDVRTLHDKMKHAPIEDAKAYAEAFFGTEYQCDYLIHTYSKPIIAWGEGIVMGGGMGLFMGASHKVVTPDSRLAMPEIHIGLFPDVGATYFLNRLDDDIGLFLGLTGVMMNGTDALDVRLADHMNAPTDKQKLLHQLQQSDWNSIEDSYDYLTEVLTELADNANIAKPAAHLLPLIPDIQRACASDTLEEVFDNIQALPCHEKWMQTAQRNLMDGSPITAHICFRQLKQYHHLSLADCFRLELILGLRSVEYGEFREGVRARLVDKDGMPHWAYAHISQVPKSVIDNLFTSLWREQEHPLALLGHH
ncbi:enoyl-CoA hydratase/isomerase family protein [Vibrio variabilis]|uniref:enoyl-CoA hydratase/isomerase family protein n=1 Tax=Vibrio variabilis TaxID=990271 RepID=UPI000DDB1B41|nr:enoyl-CoA hydratase/isomerase family protein [Vibrio variabilis]